MEQLLGTEEKSNSVDELIYVSPARWRTFDRAAERLSNGGICRLCAGSGTGRTVFVRRLYERLRHEIPTAVIDAAVHKTPNELAAAWMNSWLRAPVNVNDAERLLWFACEEAIRLGQKNVLLIDNAEQLTPAVKATLISLRQLASDCPMLGILPVSTARDADFVPEEHPGEILYLFPFTGSEIGVYLRMAFGSRIADDDTTLCEAVFKITQGLPKNLAKLKEPIRNYLQYHPGILTPKMLTEILRDNYLDREEGLKAESEGSSPLLRNMLGKISRTTAQWLSPSHGHN